MAGLLQSLASSIKSGTPALLPKGTACRLHHEMPSRFYTSNVRSTGEAQSTTDKGINAGPTPCFCCPGDFLTMSLAQQAVAWSESPHHAEVLVVLGGRQLIDWLLATACKDEASPEQGQAEQALFRLLQSGERMKLPFTTSSCTSGYPAGCRSTCKSVAAGIPWNPLKCGRVDEGQQHHCQGLE